MEAQIKNFKKAAQAKWITFVTEHGEVLGFQIIKELP